MAGAQERSKDSEGEKAAHAVKVLCPHCSQRIEVGNGLGGRMAQCPTCDGEFLIPSRRLVLAPPARRPAVTAPPIPTVAARSRPNIIAFIGSGCSATLAGGLVGFVIALIVNHRLLRDAVEVPHEDPIPKWAEGQTKDVLPFQLIDAVFSLLQWLFALAEVLLAWGPAVVIGTSIGCATGALVSSIGWIVRSSRTRVQP